MQAGPGFVPTFLYYFVSTTLIVVFIISNGLSEAEKSAFFDNPFQVGILLGLVAGGVGAYFNSYESFDFCLEKHGSNSKILAETLATMGYEKSQEIDHASIYERPFPGNFFAGKLILQFSENTVSISGRSNCIRTLKKLLEHQ